MVKVIRLNPERFRSKCRYCEYEWAKRSYTFYSQVETHISALEELLDYFELKLEMCAKGKHRAKVAELNFVEFINVCKKEFEPKASEYVDKMDQQAYANGITRTLTALRIELINACKENNQENDARNLSTLCILWK